MKVQIINDAGTEQTLMDRLTNVSKSVVRMIRTYRAIMKLTLVEVSIPFFVPIKSYFLHIPLWMELDITSYQWIQRTRFSELF